MLKNMTALSFIGCKNTLTQSFDEFIFESKVDEIIASTNIFDQKAKRRSYKIISEIFGN